jgi:hypothetical protein
LEEKDAFEFEEEIIVADAKAPVGQSVQPKINNITDDYSEDKYDSDADIIKEPEPKSDDKAKSEAKVPDEHAISNSIDEKNIPTEENIKEDSSEQQLKFIEQHNPVGDEREHPQVEDEYEQEEFENPTLTERVDDMQFNNKFDQKVDEINNEMHPQNEHIESDHHDLEVNEEHREYTEESAYADKDNPVIEEEEEHQEDNPYAQNTEGEDDEHNLDQEPRKPGMEGDNQQREGEGEGDFDLTDEEMFQIAENALLKVAHCFLVRGTTVTELFNNHITEVKYEDHSLPVISPEIFIEGLKVLEIENMTELELACLMNVLVKPQLENGILVEELESIIENAPQILNNMVSHSNFN